MLIIPFIHNITKLNNLDVHCIRILTIGGKSIWEEKGKLDLDSDILNPNDIYRKNTFKLDRNTYICEIDIEKTNINDMYKWSEIDINDNETFCWRDFMYFSGKNNENWLNIPKSEKIGNINIDKLVSFILEKK
jgi:hypothetical protein